MVINISVQYNGGFFPDIILLTQGYCFVLIAFIMYITTTMCDGVPHCLRFAFNVFLVSLHGDSCKCTV